MPFQQDNYQNRLITGHFSSTISNLDGFLRMLCAASEDDELCDPGLAQGLNLARQASQWLKNHVNDPAANSSTNDQSKEI